MRSLAPLSAIAVLGGLACTGQAQAQAPELKKIHILMVFDTNAQELVKGLRIDKRRMLAFWRDTVPPSRRSEITVLEDEKATKEEILGHYARLAVGPDEGLVFYYAGHGARDEKTGRHFLDLKKGPKLLRVDLLRAMEAKKAEMVLLLTDCCSSPQEFKEDDEELLRSREVIYTKPAERVHPTVRCLLFQARGIVDITAATDNASWSDNLKGGIFTRSVCRMFKTPIDKLDGNGDGFISSREFYPQLSQETQSLFGSWRKEMIARGEKVDVRKQVPFAFKLGKLFAVVGIENATKKVLEYSCRWPGQQEWASFQLEPGQKKAHSLPLSEQDADKPLPALEVKFPFVSKPVSLKSVEYTGLAEPTKLPTHYRIRSR